MHYHPLVHDHLDRAAVRLEWLGALFDRKSWADVVCESNEVVKLAIIALLRARGITVASEQDLLQALAIHRESLPDRFLPYGNTIVDVSRRLEQNYALAFEGSADLVPSEHYTESDASFARNGAVIAVDSVKAALRISRGAKL